METAILGGLVKEVITSLGGFAYNEIARVLGVRGEIVKLAESLQTITLELRDADQTIAHSEATDERLKRMTEIAYEAESIIDRFKIKMDMLHTSRFQEWSGSSLCRCCKEVNTRCNVAKRVEKLNKRLEDMRASRELRQVLQALGARYQRSGLSSSMIGPGHDNPNSVGSVICNDCDDHIRRLRSNSSSDQSLFAIVGAPGVGKTSLARKIYHEMKGEFGTRIWVHISSGTGNMIIWSDETLQSEASCLGSEQQKERIRSHLMGSNLLLVIDNVRDKVGWEFLGELGQGFLDRGVRVVLTSSHRDVTRMIGVNRWSGCHHVRALDEDDGWLLLLRTAQLKEHEAVGNFQEVGKRIVHKCSGLPLALKAVGSKLRHQDQLGPWMTELTSDFIVNHKEIRRSIDDSYMELGYRLKLCFLYCSLYPEGSVIEQKSIAQQWIAEGFFGGSSRGDRERTRGQEGTSLEEEAQECFTELVNRSLLLPMANGCATMPNLLRSYAIYRSQDENYVGDPRNIGHAFKVWRMYAADGDAIRDIPDDVTSLRTLLVFGSSSPRDETGANATPSPSVMSIICRRFTSLRVLDLRDAQVDSVGSSLGRLLQLRYLNLSNTRITKLPREVRNLVMLQYLILNNCRHLTSLPMGVGCLKNLRSLDISENLELQNIQFRLPNLKELNCFRGFLPAGSGASASSGWTFMELSKLSKLTSLQILKLGSGTSRQEAAQLRLHEMSHLKELELLCSTPVGHGRPAGGDADDESIGGVLGELKPPQHLTSVKLADFYGSELPSWVSSSHLTQLQRLTLAGCLRCQRLPPSLGEMRHLSFLAITGCDALSDISNGFRGAPVNLVAFPRLEKLTVGEMPRLETWSGGLEERDMPLLRSFQLSGCPRLSALPPWLARCTALASLEVHRADELREIRGLPSLKELRVGSCRALRRISELGRLEDLEVAECSGLDAVEGVPLLRSLRLVEHKHATELPRWLPKPPPQPSSSWRLRRLEIVGGEELLDSCAWEHAPCWPLIEDAADLVYAKVRGDGPDYFSYTRSTRRFRRSLQCRKRADAYGYGATVRSIAAPPPPEKTGGKSRDLLEAKAWMWRALYGLVAAFLIGSAVLLSSTSGTRSSANATLAA